MLKSNSPVNFSRMKTECLWIPAYLCTWGMLVSWDNYTPCHVFCFTWTQNCHRNAYKHFLFSSPAHVAHTWGLLAARLASAGKGETLPAWKAVPFMWVKSSQSPTVFMAWLRTALKTSTSTENSETWGGSELQQRLQQLHQCFSEASEAEIPLLCLSALNLPLETAEFVSAASVQGSARGQRAALQSSGSWLRLCCCSVNVMAWTETFAAAQSFLE